MVLVDKDACIACGLCFGTHSEFFTFGPDGKAEAIKQPTTDEEIATIQEAIDNCPVGAISDTKVVEMTPPQDIPMAA
jgi:ferredoxin